jgi:hypothetical protein
MESDLLLNRGRERPSASVPKHFWGLLGRGEFFEPFYTHYLVEGRVPRGIWIIFVGLTDSVHQIRDFILIT